MSLVNKAECATERKLKATLKLYFRKIELDFIQDGWDKNDAFCVVQEAIMTKVDDILEEIADDKK